MKKSLMNLMAFVLALSISLRASSVQAQVFDKKEICSYLKSQQSSTTGLVNSFTNTSDERLINQAATYDQALAVITFSLCKQFKDAKRILSFFEKKWNDLGFANFYNTQDGSIGIEGTVHLGPNMWIAIAALQYDAMTQTKEFGSLARKIALWASKLRHEQDGGLAMGPRADWGADWTGVFSAENNIDAYAVFRHLSLVVGNEEESALYRKEQEGIKRFLRKEIFSKKPRIPVGPQNDEMASDVFALSILVFKPSDLFAYFDISTDELFMLLEKYFYVQTDGISGYDFADAASREKAGRTEMISLEWSAMVATAYLSMADYHHQVYSLTQKPQESEKANKYLFKARDILDNLDKKALPYSQKRLAYPYATKAFEQVFPFAPWWKTPQRGDKGRLAGALSSTCWRLFAEEKFNPLSIYKRKKDENP